MSKKSHHFLTLWPWPLTYDLEKLIRSGHYHYQCVYQIWEQSIPWFLSYRVNTIVGGGRRAAGGGRLRRKTITSPDPSDTGDMITIQQYRAAIGRWHGGRMKTLNPHCPRADQHCGLLPGQSECSNSTERTMETACSSWPSGPFQVDPLKDWHWATKSTAPASVTWNWWMGKVAALHSSASKLFCWSEAWNPTHDPPRPEISK